jgi:uncharacterized protein YlxP (DUF503 family)
MSTLHKNGDCSERVQGKLKVGLLQVRLFVRESRSLKEKRQVLRSIKDRLRNQFNVSVAEVGAQDHRQLIVLGMAMVSNEAGHIQATLDEIVRKLRGHPIAEFLGHEVEV